MEPKWVVQYDDVRAVGSLLQSTKRRRFVKFRLRRNISGNPHRFSRERFWRVMIGCLLTTQQRAGPDSPVSRFMRIKPFPLRLVRVANHSGRKIQRVVRRELSKVRGIRRGPTIAKQAAANYRWLEREGWELVAQQYSMLLKQRGREARDGDRELERSAARFIEERLDGFGPKQARNLWQWLGMTRYEIPLDSRVTKWLNKSVGGLKLNAAPLGDRTYYEFVLDGIQALCRKACVLPCTLDAAIFATFDRNWRAAELRDSV